MGQWATSEKDTLSLRGRILRAGGWTFAGHFSAQFLRLLSNLVLTRLLLPQVFGVMSLANVVLTGLSLFSDIGLGQNVIQSKRGSEETYLNTVWTVQIVRGVLIWIAASLMALGILFADSLHLMPAGSGYAEPILPRLICVLSINPLLGGFLSTRVATASRRLALGRLTLMDLYSQISGLVVMVVWALREPSPWALVGGSIVSTLVRVGLSHTFLQGEKNRLHWDHDAFHEIFAFGKWIFVTSLIGYLSANGDRLLLGALVDAKTLGIYVIAFFIANAVSEVFSKAANSVGYPALSEVVRNRPQDLMRTYYKFRAPIDATSMLIAGLMFVSGHLIIRLLYNSQYQPAGHMLEILSVSLLEVRYGLAGTSLVAMGMPKLLAPILLVRVISLFVTMPWAFSMFGMEGALWANVASLLLTIPITIFYKVKYKIFSLRQELIYLPLVVVGVLLGLGLNAFIGSMTLSHR